MAARKSCTHMTWAEAKAKSGIGGSGTKKSKNPPKNVPHGQILAQKIIAKQQSSVSSGSNDGSSGGGVGEKLVGKKSLRKQQREDEKAAAAIAAEKERKEQARRNRTIKPYRQALEKRSEIATTLQTKWKYTMMGSDDDHVLTETNDIETMKQIADSIGMQLDEVMALEAIFADTNEFGICDATNIDQLRQLHESWLEDEDNEITLKRLVCHLDTKDGSGGDDDCGAPISFTIQLNVQDENKVISTGNNDDGDKNNMKLAALIVLHVVLPPLYPNNSVSPQIKIHDCMVCDMEAVCSPDKPLETLAFLNETKLQDALATEIEGILPYPCIYEVGVTWLAENVFHYLELRNHL